jgi:hypothetical protein
MVSNLPDVSRMVESRRMRWLGHVVRIVEKTDAYRVWWGKHEGKTPLGKSKGKLGG